MKEVPLTVTPCMIPANAYPTTTTLVILKVGLQRKSAEMSVSVYRRTVLAALRIHLDVNVKTDGQVQNVLKNVLEEPLGDIVPTSATVQQTTNVITRLVLVFPRESQWRRNQSLLNRDKPSG